MDIDTVIGIDMSVDLQAAKYAIEGRKQEIFGRVASMDTQEFMNFALYILTIPHGIMRQHYQNGRLDEDTRYSQLQQGYQKDREGFLQKFASEFGGLLRGMQQGSEMPDELPPNLAYNFLDSHKNNWLKFLRQKIGLEVSEQEMKRCRRILRRHQKYDVLEQWWSEQRDAGLETVEKLDMLLKQYENEASSFEESSMLPSDQQVVGTATTFQTYC